MGSLQNPDFSHINPLLRPRADPSSLSQQPERPPSSPQTLKFIHFRHPGYDDRRNLMFRLPALDPRRDETADSWEWGIHNGTALRACSILACNTEGFLSVNRLPPRSPVPPSPPPTTLDAILTAPSYYFYPSSILGNTITHADFVYAVCPSFSNWEFPHQRIPRGWAELYPESPGDIPSQVPSQSQISAAVEKRDSTCRVSGFGDSPNIAHLIPKDDRDWFTANQMQVYNLNPVLSLQYITSDINNVLCLRADLHSAFDRSDFVFVPKAGSSCMHFLKPTSNYGRLYHNRISGDIRVPAEFLYAHFAWAILPLAHVFANSPGTKVVVLNTMNSKWEKTTIAPETSAPPAKRPRRNRYPSKPTANPNGNGRDTNSTSLEYSTTTKRLKLMPVSTPKPTSPTSNPHRLRAKQTFEKIVAADPQRAWNSINWHPEIDMTNAMREKYLLEHEPLHLQETERQQRILEEGGVLFDDSPQEEGGVVGI